jgi:hypothetical protein
LWSFDQQGIMGALGVPLMQTSAEAPSHDRRIGKLAMVISLVGVVCVTAWAFSSNELQVAAEDSATSMAVAPTMQLPKLRSPMVQQVRTRSFMPPVQASKSTNEYPSGEIDIATPLGKREMMGGAIASAAAALPLAANAGVIIDDPNKAGAARKGPGLLLAVPALVLGWVGFNILGPALNQLDDMNEVDKARNSGPPKRR